MVTPVRKTTGRAHPVAFPAKKAGVVAKKTASPAAKKTAAKTPQLSPEQKKKLFLHKAPVDMKPAFLEVSFRTSKDGLLSPKIKLDRVKGRWDNPENKRFDMLEYDTKTAVALYARLFAKTWAANPLKRLTANTTFQIVMRVGKQAATGAILTNIVAIRRLVKKGETQKWVWFDKVKDKLDPDYRKIRSTRNFLRGAFTEMQLPPSGRQPKKDAEE